MRGYDAASIPALTLPVRPAIRRRGSAPAPPVQAPGAGTHSPRPVSQHPPQRLPASGRQLRQLIVLLLLSWRVKQRGAIGEKEFLSDPLIALCRPPPPHLFNVLRRGKAQLRAVGRPQLTFQEFAELKFERSGKVRMSRQLMSADDAGADARLFPASAVAFPCRSSVPSASLSRPGVSNGRYDLRQVRVAPDRRTRRRGPLLCRRTGTAGGRPDRLQPATDTAAAAAVHLRCEGPGAAGPGPRSGRK